MAQTETQHLPVGSGIDAPYPPALAWYAVGILLVATIIGYVDRLVMAFLVDPVKQSLGISDTEVGLLNGLAFSFFFVLMGIPMGRLVDTRRRTAVLSVAIAAWSVMTVSCGVAWNYATLFLARMGVGAGEAALNPAAVSMISDMFPSEKVAKPIGIFTLGIYIGGGLAIILGGALIEFFGLLGPISVGPWESIEAWRLIFVIVGLPGLVVAAIIILTIREPRRTHVPSRQTGSASGSLAEVRDYLLQHRRLYLLMYGGFIAFGFYVYAVLGWYPAFLMRTYEVSPNYVAWGYGGIFLLAGIAGALLVGPLTRMVRSRGHLDAPVILCFWAMLIGGPAAILGPLSDSPDLCLALFVVTMLCWALTISLAFAAIALVTVPNMRGTMTGTFMVLMNTTGGALGAVVVGALSDYVFGPESIRYAIAAVASVAFPLAAALFAASRPDFRRIAALYTGTGTSPA